MKIQYNEEDLLVPGDLGVSNGRKAVCFLTRVATGSRESMFVIRLEAAQNSLEFYHTANGSVLRYATVPAEFLTKIINIKDEAQMDVQAK